MTGEAQYVDDLQIANCAVAQVVTSPHAHAVIRRIDTARAKAVPGVLAVLTHELCVAEPDRPGRLEGLDDRLFTDIQGELDAKFAPQSAIVAHGRVGVAAALAQARTLLSGGCARVLVAATDSLLTWPTLSHYEREDRLLTARNSNGFMPGEGAGALLVGAGEGQSGKLVCTGIGFGREAAHLDSGEPLRAEGLSLAIKAALADAGCAMHDMDFRITDLSGEQYYFKEAALALSRTLRQRKEEFDLWHPAECTGEQGAAAGLAVVALADAACRKAFTKGPNILVHLANDAGRIVTRLVRVLNDVLDGVDLDPMPAGGCTTD